MQFFYKLNLFNQSDKLKDYDKYWSNFYKQETERRGSENSLTNIHEDILSSLGQIFSNDNLKIQIY